MEAIKSFSTSVYKLTRVIESNITGAQDFYFQVSKATGFVVIVNVIHFMKLAST